VKVGTLKRSKGLEFKLVLLARVDGSLLSPAAADLDDGALERREIERRELHVGMTRARDGLWVGLGSKFLTQCLLTPKTLARPRRLPKCTF